MKDKLIQSKNIAYISFFIVIAIGIFFRFDHIAENNFLFYDEGMWLGYNREFLRLLEHNPPKNVIEFQKALALLSQLSLATAKSFWAFLSMIRVFFVGESGYYFTRVISAILGTLTLGLVYFLGNYIYKDKRIGLLAAVILAVLPSHVFYSRLALQESLSAFFFTLGIYLYVSSSKINWRTICSALCFVLVFLSNYRMIIAPIFLAVFECVYSLANRQKINFRRYFWHTLTFLFFVFLIGSLYQGKNTQITFAWMFYQAHLASGTLKAYNFLSFPYYLFRLESFVLGICFFSQIYFVLRKDWLKCFLFLFILFQMFVFSLSEEKGVRYLASCLPLLAISVSATLIFYYQKLQLKYTRILAGVFLVLMIFQQIYNSFPLIENLSDYQQSANDLKQKYGNVKVLSTQNQIQQLYFEHNSRVLEPPTTSILFLKAYLNGYHFLILDPQAYVSFTEDKKRFSVELRSYLSFITKNVAPNRTYQHMNPQIFERFVLEHNVDLKQSLRFLNYQYGTFSSLYVYDIKECLLQLKKKDQKASEAP